MGDKTGEGEKHFTFVDKRKRGSEDETVKPEPSPAPKEPVESQAPQEDAEGAAPPPIDFSTFILSLSSSAVYHMGGFQDPYSGKTSINLDLAKQSIDILAMMEEKTRGNLAPDEQRLLSHTLYDLRMRFVELLNHK
ncbi:MAG: DUF1844 domain-containing protein [Nitrospinae bacterium]|nr:DUF1844 domain-containing protein [Nitrospinota bacterium]